MSACEIDSSVLVDTLDDITTFELQRHIFAHGLRSPTRNPHENDNYLYFADFTKLYGDKRGEIKGPFSMRTSIANTLSKQFKILESRLKYYAKKNTKIREIVARAISQRGKRAFLPADEHVLNHASVIKYINPRMIPSKYVVLCGIEISEVTAEIVTSYHFVRWYSPSYVKKSVASFSFNNFFENMTSMIVKDDIDNAYEFPCIESSQSSEDDEDIIYEIPDDDMPDLIYIP
jgi:hypothetical protein